MQLFGGMVSAKGEEPRILQVIYGAQGVGIVRGWRAERKESSKL